MLGFIYGLVRDFEQEHGVHPNLLYLNRSHSEHLIAAFAEGHSLGRIMDLLQMEIVIDPSNVHPHVAWTQAAQRAAS